MGAATPRALERRLVHADWTREQWLIHADLCRAEASLILLNHAVEVAYTGADRSGHRPSRNCAPLVRARGLAARRDRLEAQIDAWLASLYTAPPGGGAPCA